MTIESFVRALPKVELSLQLDGALPLNTLLMIADHNDIAGTLKGYRTWLASVKSPEPKRAFEIARMAASWLRHPDDLRRIVYDVGLGLAKQNVVYAEIGIAPSLFEGVSASLEELFAAANDGADRVRRAWGLEMAWVVMIPRDEPRRSDELSRWATTAAARKANVVGMGVSGKESTQPAGQFERAFRAVEKKELPRIVRAGDSDGAEGILDAIGALSPTRLIDARGLLDSPEALQLVIERGITVVMGGARSLKAGFVRDLADLPLHALIDAGVRVTVGADMPSIYGTTLTDDYLALVRSGALTTDSLEDVVLNAARGTALAPEAREALVERLRGEIASLRETHLVPGGA